MSNSASRIKIMYVIGQLGVGGTEHQLLDLARNLDSEKFVVMVVSLSSQSPLADSLRDAGCEVRVLGRETHSRIFIFRAIYSLVSSFQPDIVHAFAYASRAAIPIALLFRKTKKIVSIRTQSGWGITRLDRMINSFADYILTNSKAAASTRFGFRGPVPGEVIYNGIDLAKFDEEVNTAFFPPVSGEKDSQVICVVARLHPVKGHMVLLDAFSKIAAQFETVQLWLVGNGPEREKLERRTAQLGLVSKVVYWGEQERVSCFLAQADIGVLSSRAEGLPNAVIEYMAARLPVVATAVGGNPELVVHDQAGLLVPPDDAQALAEALIYLLRNPEIASRMGDAGRKRVETDFTLERMVRETEDLYLRLFRGENGC